MTLSFEDDMPVQIDGTLMGPSDSDSGRLFNNLMFEDEGQLDQSPGHLSLGAASFAKGRPSPEAAANSPSRFGNFSTQNPLSIKTDPTKKELFPQTVQVDIYTGDPRSDGEANEGEPQPCCPQGSADHPIHTSLRCLGLEPSLSTTVSQKAYLTAPCDGDPTCMTLVRHQSAGLLELYLEVEGGKQMFLAAAYKRRGSYALFQERGETDTASHNYLGKVTTSFPNRTDYLLEEYEDGQYVNTAGVSFKKRFSATGVPRRLTAVVPDRDRPSAWRLAGAGNLVSAYRATKGFRKVSRTPMSDAGLEVLKSAMPFWDERANGYVLDMSPRIKLPSVKNFQMKRLLDGVTEPQGETLLEFGKNTSSMFALECRAPVSILQAFSVAVAMVDSSLMITM